MRGAAYAAVELMLELDQAADREERLSVLLTVEGEHGAWSSTEATERAETVVMRRGCSG